MSEDSVSLYLIASFGREFAEGCIFKIGISSNPASRLKSLKTACPFEIDLVMTLPMPTRRDAAGLERMIHGEFSDIRTSGEWFKGSVIDASTAIDECAIKYWVQKGGKTFEWSRSWMIGIGKGIRYVDSMFAINRWPQ